MFLWLIWLFNYTLWIWMTLYPGGGGKFLGLILSGFPTLLHLGSFGSYISQSRTGCVKCPPFRKFLLSICSTQTPGLVRMSLQFSWLRQNLSLETSIKLLTLQKPFQNWVGILAHTTRQQPLTRTLHRRYPDWDNRGTGGGSPSNLATDKSTKDKMHHLLNLRISYLFRSKI